MLRWFSVTLIGLTKKDIPFYAQIIYIADVFDAIVSKRQYKTHINISETLKLLLKDAVPSRQSIALDNLSTQSRCGKINYRVLKILFKVVVDDTLYEISCTMEYVNFLKEQLKRLAKIRKYEEKMNHSKREKDKECTIWEKIENDETIQKLYHEIDIIKKLKAQGT